MIKRIAGIFVLLVACGMSGSGAFADIIDDVRLLTLLENANTPTQHLAVQEYYVERARWAGDRAAFHQDLLSRYESKGMTKMVRHCIAVEARFNEIAEEYRAMAAEHGQLAEQ